MDIIFIHGLGGTSLRTWCFRRDVDYLWPQLWLPEEEGLSTARILTYGYDAHFSSKKERASLAIGDFANDLLFRMRYSENGPYHLGQVPIVVVAHSMGGLVFKKAYIHGLLNDEFRSIVSMINAVLFLATPHRGTNLADTLNKVLTSSVFGHTSKEYVAELTRRSPTIDDLNESFRHHASKLKLFSFYETLSTAIGPMSSLIVDKNTGVLGYPGETPQPLIANHHDVCKFKSPQDPNYVSIVGALRSVVGLTIPSDASEREFEADLKLTKELLGVTGPPAEDLAVARAVRKQGTCQNFLSSRDFIDWRTSNSSRILWAYAGPGNGKTTLCSMVIDHLFDEGESCSYYFFKYDNVKKRRISNLLISLAFQTAIQDREVCCAFAELATSGSSLQKANARVIWKELYLDIFAGYGNEKHVFWILDAVDESESAREVVDILSTVGDFGPRVHILILSRPEPPILQAIHKAKRRIDVKELSLSDNEADIRTAVADEIDYLPSDDKEFKNQIIKEITERSQGNFLWASLVVKQVASCRRQEQIKRALEASPDGMDSLYDRMLESVSSIDVQEDVDLARIMLSWAMYARTPLTIEELSGPYDTELKSVMDLKHTINDVCGGFVFINANNRVTLVHHSAKEYLRRNMGQRVQFSLGPTKAHEDLLGKCLVTICDKELRSRLQALKVPPFFQYAATSWAFHLENCSAHSDRVLNGLTKFFKGQFTLSWIQYLAMSGHLSDIPGVARILISYVRKRRKIDAERPPLLHRISDLSLIENWAIDLQKIAVKFGRNLSEDPSMIFKCVPTLSPSSSIVSQRFSRNPATTLSVSGNMNDEWDDCIARVSGSSGRALRLSCSSLYLAVAAEAPRGSVTVWDTMLFQEFRAFNMNQRISELVFNDTGSLLACCGITRTCVWRLKDGATVLTAKNPPHERAIDLKFDENDALFMVTDIRGVYKLSQIESFSDKVGWVRLSPELLKENTLPEGVWLGTPTGVAFNADCSQIAVAYKGFPPAIWSLDPPCVIARLPGRRKHHAGRPPPTSYAGGSKVVWHPSGTYVLGIHGDIFKWNPADDAYDIVQGETDVTPKSIECSPNGLVFITGDVQGSIKIYEVASMALIYKLTSEDGIDRICFSPDSLRFYDLRGSYCNVWEPNCLARLADASVERFSDSASTDDNFWSDTDDTLSTSISFAISESHANNKPAVTAIAAHLDCGLDQLVAYSTEDGSIELYHEKKDVTYTAGRTASGAIVEHLACSNADPYLAVSDAYGTVVVKEVSIKAGVLKTKDIYVDATSSTQRGHVAQLLFASSANILLIYGEKLSQTYTIPDGKLVGETDLLGEEVGTWVPHASSKDLIVMLSTGQVTICNWNLDILHVIPLSLTLLSSPTSNSVRVEKTVGSLNARHFTLRTVVTEAGRIRHGFVVLPTSILYAGTNLIDDETLPIRSLELPQSLLDTVQYALGTLPDGRIVFLDRSLWVCTATLPEWKSVIRHFFIPHDWVTSTGILLCQILIDGTFLCPTKGRVAIMKSNIMSNWG